MPLSSLGLSDEYLSGQDISAPSSLCPPPNELICLGLPTPHPLPERMDRTWQKNKKKKGGMEEAASCLPACAQSP